MCVNSQQADSRDSLYIRSELQMVSPEPLPRKLWSSRVASQYPELVSHGLIIDFICFEQATRAVFQIIVAQLLGQPCHFALPNLHRQDAEAFTYLTGTHFT